MYVFIMFFIEQLSVCLDSWELSPSCKGLYRGCVSLCLMPYLEGKKMGKENQTKVIAFGVLIVVGILVYAVFFKPQTTIVNNNPVPGVGNTGVTQCAIAPSIVSSVTDALSPGTAVTTTNYYRNNGIYTGTTAPTYASTSDILFTASNYLSVIKSGVALGCGANQVSGSMYALANASLTYYGDNGLIALSVTQNETVKAAGTAYNWKLHFQGTDKKSTGKQLFIVELSVPGNVSSVSMSGAEVVAVPNGYTRQATNGYAAAFLLPAITGTVPQDFFLTAQSATGKVISGTVYTTIYSVQPFVEVDGTFSDEGKAFDSLNAAKSATSQTKNFIIA